MALPVIAAAAARGGAAATKGLKKTGGIPGLGGGNSGRSKPYVLSTEGVVMLMVAGLIELGNVVLATLDLAFGVGTILAPFLNGVAMFIIGGWLWKKTGKLPLKKVLLPFGLNMIPIVRLLPFWLWSVWSALDKSSSSAESQEQSI